MPDGPRDCERANELANALGPGRPLRIERVWTLNVPEVHRRPDYVYLVTTPQVPALMISMPRPT